MTVDAWLALHRGHGDLTHEPFPHPSGDWYYLVCACGAKMVTLKGGDRAETTESPTEDQAHP